MSPALRSAGGHQPLPVAVYPGSASTGQRRESASGATKGAV
jgi:hypothetical protein